MPKALTADTALIRPSFLLPLATALALVGGLYASRRSLQNLEQAASGRTQAWTGIAAGAALLACLGFVAVPVLLSPPATDHAYGAAVLALSGYGALHTFLCLLGSGFARFRTRAGYVSAMRIQDVRNPAMLWTFTATTGLLLLVLIHFLPLVASG